MAIGIKINKKCVDMHDTCVTPSNQFLIHRIVRSRIGANRIAQKKAKYKMIYIYCINANY